MVELYVDPQLPWNTGFGSLRNLTRAAVDGQTRPTTNGSPRQQPISVVSGYFDASDPITRRWLMAYAKQRGVAPRDPYAWRLYLINVDLYTEFVAFTVSRRLMDAEARRLKQAPLTANNPAF